MPIFFNIFYLLFVAFTNIFVFLHFPHQLLFSMHILLKKNLVLLNLSLQLFNFLTMRYFLEFVQSRPWNIRFPALRIWHVRNIRLWSIWTCFISWITKLTITLWCFIHYLGPNLICISRVITPFLFNPLVNLFFLLIDCVTINNRIKSCFEVPNAFFCVLMSTWFILVFLNAIFTNRFDLIFFFILGYVLMQTRAFF